MADDDAPTPPQYAIPAERTNARQQIRADYLLTRADVLQDLLALVPDESRARALAMLMQAEQIRAREDDATTNEWLQDVLTAYLTGRSEVATEQLQAMTGEAHPFPADDGTTILH